MNKKLLSEERRFAPQIPSCLVLNIVWDVSGTICPVWGRGGRITFSILKPKEDLEVCLRSIVDIAFSAGWLMLLWKCGNTKSLRVKKVLFPPDGNMSICAILKSVWINVYSVYWPEDRRNPRLPISKQEASSGAEGAGTLGEALHSLMTRTRVSLHRQC